jgi:hypothetical protein
MDSLMDALDVRPAAERQRQAEAQKGGAAWWRWGPYLSERQWGTVREDYSPGGIAWDAFPHDHARSRTYRWGEDGLLGISDNHSRLCFAVALWNEADPILKERLFGLTGRCGVVPTRPVLARSRAVSRILPRRYRPWRRRQPPDRLDWARRQTPGADVHSNDGASAERTRCRTSAGG